MSLEIEKLGRIGYQEAWDLQRRYFDECLRGERPDSLLLCEHPHTFTVGKNGVDSFSKHLLFNQDQLREHGLSVFEIDRGGDITYHGPGQIVGYPILNLNRYYRDVHRYLRDLEEVILRTISEWGIQGRRIESITGVWVETKTGPEKICAIGVKVTRWITMHGFALNVNTNLDYFNGIVPCGISDKGVTSMERILGKTVALSEVENTVARHFERVFVPQKETVL